MMTRKSPEMFEALAVAGGDATEGGQRMFLCCCVPMYHTVTFYVKMLSEKHKCCLRNTTWTHWYCDHASQSLKWFPEAVCLFTSQGSLF